MMISCAPRAAAILRRPVPAAAKPGHGKSFYNPVVVEELWGD